MAIATLLFGMLILLAEPSDAEDITRKRGRDGRVYFTNRAPLVNSTPSTPRSRYARIMPLVYTLARKYDIDAQLVRAVISVESNFNVQAISRAGAQGLMQLMPATAAHYGVADPFDPEANIEGGIRFLKDLWHRYQGDVNRVLAAYNAGENAVKRYGGVPPYPETQRYVVRVLALYNRYGTSSRIYRYRTARGRKLFTDTPR